MRRLVFVSLAVLGTGLCTVEYIAWFFQIFFALGGAALHTVGAVGALKVFVINKFQNRVVDTGNMIFHMILLSVLPVISAGLHHRR